MAYDLIIRGGMVVDGTGCEPYIADVAVTADRVVAVGTDLGEHTKCMTPVAAT